VCGEGWYSDKQAFVLDHATQGRQGDEPVWLKPSTIRFRGATRK
jgi:hypothetical protein